MAEVSFSVKFAVVFPLQVAQIRPQVRVEAFESSKVLTEVPLEERQNLLSDAFTTRIWELLTRNVLEL